MTDVGLAVGASFIAIGGIMAIYGTVLCITSKGSMYNAEDVDAMVQATVMEEEKQRQQEEALFEDFRPGDKNKRKKVLMA